MKRFVAGADRGQWTLLPECLDDFIDESIQPTPASPMAHLLVKAHVAPEQAAPNERLTIDPYQREALKAERRVALQMD